MQTKTNTQDNARTSKNANAITIHSVRYTCMILLMKIWSQCNVCAIRYTLYTSVIALKHSVSTGFMLTGVPLDKYMHYH